MEQRSKLLRRIRNDRKAERDSQISEINKEFIKMGGIGSANVYLNQYQRSISSASIVNNKLTLTINDSFVL